VATGGIHVYTNGSSSRSRAPAARLLARARQRRSFRSARGKTRVPGEGPRLASSMPTGAAALGVIRGPTMPRPVGWCCWKTGTAAAAAPGAYMTGETIVVVGGIVVRYAGLEMTIRPAASGGVGIIGARRR
jgi:hypothetical protein